MRRPANDSFALIQPQTVLAPAASPDTPLAPAQLPTGDPFAATTVLPAAAPGASPAAETPAFTAETGTVAASDPLFTAADPFPSSTDPFPTPVDPFPVVPDPFPTVPDPFPVVPDPFPTPVNPFAPAPSSPSPPPVAPTPEPGPPGGNLPVTLAELDQSDVAVNGPEARATGLTGAGIKIGIISNSFDVLGGAAADVAAGLLPAGGVTVLQEGPAGSDDEGRAMAELVHATAPGAQLYFASAAYSEVGFAENVTALQDAGCQIIVDDVGYFDEPMFQNAGALDGAITSAVADNVNYFTAVGNDANAAYQAACVPQSVNIPGVGSVLAQTFGGATTQTVTVLGGVQEYLTLQWNAPYETPTGDPIAVEVLSGSNVLAVSQQQGSLPDVELAFPFSDASFNYSLAIIYNSGVATPSLFKYELLGNAGIIDNTAGGETTGAVYGHPMLPGVNGVGAVNVADTPSQGGSLSPEPFSDSGGSEFLFAPNGTPLSSPQISGAPEYLAPDGSDTSIFQPFEGTSAAAPVAAAVAALMLQANPALTTADVTALLEDSAIATPSTDDSAGDGLIQANLATQFATTDVISGSQQAVVHGISQPCTIQGGAGSHWLIAGSGATEIVSQGNDSVQAGAGADTVDLTGAQADVYGSTGPLWVRGMGGNDTVVGGSGAMTVSGAAGGGVIYGSTGGGNELTAGAEATTILSQGTGDVVSGTGSGDLLYASNLGDDTVVGGAGTEILIGGTSAGGTDSFLAGSGSPLIAPEASNAVVTFGSGNTTALLGTGSQVLEATNGQAGGMDWVLDFNPATDMLQLNGYNQPAAEAAIASQYDTGGDSWLKLPDGTVIAFVGLDHLAASNVSYG